ncbi:sorbin and SH3 domain-containing protein 1-like [Stegodyphus dumicola]|uniref:sorbin and SH3 domain-containing protein 1-like n=1 Tax=Stegodyphus dumicola TaxID=202533 RepID=UPI0015AEF73D|nr:sorbin and SH3 domain-containing protein 1-like [Stegodyphus dumicola]
MFKSLHKADSSNDTQEYIIGYSSEPETSGKDKMLKKKSATLDSRLRYDSSSKPSNNLYKQAYPPSAKSSIEIYNVRPRLIEDYEPGQSSVTDNDIRASSKRFLPEVRVPKPTYEYKNGYESDNSYMRKVEQPEGLTSEQQKVWYREIQRGGDIPQFGLGKPAPEKPKEPTIGPLPPPPLNYVQPSCPQATRPQTLPADYMNQNDSGFCQQMNGVYEVQMRQALHSELQQRMSPCSSQLSPNRSIKSPSRSPDLRIPARALFDFKAESPKEISLKKGDMVMILRQLDKNWYEGEHQGTIGIFPISYVEIVPPEHVSSPVKASTDGIAKALYDFVAQTSVELSVRKGDTVSLIRRVDANWYEARFNNKKGIIPVSYLQVLQEPVDRNVNSLSPKSYSNSSRCNSAVNDKLLKSSSNPPSPYSASTPSPISVTEGREKFQRGRKGSCLVEPVMYRAIYSYSPQNSDELELQEGDTICVMEMCDDGWYLGTSVRTGVFGIFPGNYVEKV